MTSIDAKLIEARAGVRGVRADQMGYTNPLNVTERLNGPGLDRLPT